MRTIVVLSPSREEGLKIVDGLSSNKGFRVDLVGTPKSVFNLLSGALPQLIVYNVNPFGLEGTKMIGKMRAESPTTPIVIVTSRSNKEAIAAAKLISHIYIVERPFEATELLLLCQKISKGEAIYQRIHKRYPTQQVAVIENMETAVINRGIIYNMSKGGAFVELTEGEVKRGDILRVIIQLKEIGKGHILFGEVMWVVEKSVLAGNPGAGIRFASEDEINMVIEKRTG